MRVMRAQVKKRRMLGAALGALLGDLAAAQEQQRPPALTLEVDYTGEVFGNAHGGLRTGARYLDSLDVTALLDGAVFGAEGLTLSVYGLWNNGEALSVDLVGDAQVVSNIESVRAVRLLEAWAEQRFSLGSVRAGLYDASSEFDVIEAGALFVGSSHGTGPELSLSGKHGPSMWPFTSLGVRAELATAGFALRFAALDGVPGDPDRPRRTTIRFDEGDGALLLGQLERQFESNARAALGAWHYTASFDRVRERLTGIPGRGHRGSSGVYAFVEGPLWSEPGASSEGLSGFFRAGYADEDVNPFSHYLGAGLVYTGALPGRPEDRLGLAIAVARFGQSWRGAQRSLGARWARSEINVELTYRFALTSWLALQPNAQYVVNPSGDPALRDALAIGLRFTLSAARSW